MGNALATIDAPDAPPSGASIEDRLAAIEAAVARIESNLNALGRDARALADAAGTVTAKLSGGGGIMSLLMGKG